MSSKGWIKLHRSIQDDWVWDDKPFSYGQAWIDILLMANHKDRNILFNKELIEVKAGQFITSVRKLSDKWGWGHEKTLRYLRMLEQDGKINRDSDNNRTLLSVVKYSDFQGVPNTDPNTHQNTEQNTHPNSDPNTNRPQTRIKECKEEKNVCVSAKPTDHTHTSSYSSPTRAEVKAYVDNNNLVIDADRFFDYYDSREWQGVYDWRAYARNWNKEDKASGKGAESGKKYNDYSDSLRV